MKRENKAMSKKKVLFFAMHRPDRSPSQRYRIEQFFPYLDEQQADYKYDYILDEKMDKSFYQPGALFAKLKIVLFSLYKLSKLSFFEARKYDVIFVQREAFMMGTAFFEKRMAKHSVFVFDFDDSIWMHHVSEANKKLAFLKNPAKTSEIIKVSDKVIAGNQFLANYARQFSNNVSIIPTCLNTDEYKRSTPLEEKKDGKICIGWSGSLTTIKHYKLAIPYLKKIKDKYGDKVYFKVIGDESFEDETIGVKGLKWERHTEISELEEIDIGIMPLPNDKWSLGKCGLKGLVYMSMEIPAVLSAVGFNNEIIEHEKNGFLCETDDEWFETLSKLIEDKALRKEIGAKGRVTILEKYSVEVNKTKFYDLIFS